MLIFLHIGSPSGDSAPTRNGSFIGPSQVTALDHFGFSLNNGKELLEKVRAAGVRVEFIEGRQFSPESANIFTPDGLRVEMSGTEGDRAKRVLIGFSGRDLDLTVASDHLHYYLPGRVAEEAQSWYVKLLGATPLTRPILQVARWRSAGCSSEVLRIGNEYCLGPEQGPGPRSHRLRCYESRDSV